MTFFLLIFVALIVSGLANKPKPWTPIALSSVPLAKPDELVDLFVVRAPLLVGSYGKLLGGLGLWHGGIAFRNPRTNYSWTTNYDSDSLNLFTSQWPEIDGSQLRWRDNGSVFVYAGINETYWYQPPDSHFSVKGSVHNGYLHWLANRNASWPHYEMFSIRPAAHPDSVFVPSRECFDFQLASLRYMRDHLAAPQIQGVVRRVRLAWFTTDQPPVLLDYANNGAVRARVLAFYDLLSLAFSKVRNWFDVVATLVELFTDSHEFIYHSGERYFAMHLANPFLGVHDRNVTI